MRVRTDRWRHIRYSDGREELDDHSKDEYEWTNLANKPEFAALMVKLAAKLPVTNVPEMKRTGTSDAGESEDKPAISDEIKAQRRAKRQAAKKGAGQSK